MNACLHIQNVRLFQVYIISFWLGNGNRSRKRSAVLSDQKLAWLFDIIDSELCLLVLYSDNEISVDDYMLIH
jgi:hypothetical protein